MEQRQWWERPHLWSDEDEVLERRVDWLELFFDLVFVIVIAELAHHLAAHISLAGLTGYALLFIPAWWIWIGCAFYTERFETNDISFRLFIFSLMIPVAAMAIFVHDALGEGGAAFALAYATARALVTSMYLRAGWYVPVFRPIAQRYAAGFSLSILLFIASAFVAPPTRFLLWAIGLTIDLVTPMITPHLQRRLPRFTGSRLPERFGLFVIIVLGEAVAGVIRGVASVVELSLTTGIIALLGMLLVFSLWWVYFDYVGRWRPRLGPWWIFAWNYLHLPLVMAIAAIGAGVLGIIAPTSETATTNPHRLLVGATAVALVVIGLIELTLRPNPQLLIDRRLTAALKCATGIGAAALGIMSNEPDSITTVLVLLGLMAVHVTYGAYAWYRRTDYASLAE